MPAKRAAMGAMRLNSPTLDSPEMSENEPFLAGYERTSPNLGKRPPPLGLSSPSPLGLKHFSSAPSSPSALPAYSPRVDAISPISSYFSDAAVPGTPTTAVAAVAGNRRFRLLAFSAIAIAGVIGFASLGAADPERLQHVVAPVKDVWHAAGSAAHKSYDGMKSWMGYDHQWQQGSSDPAGSDSAKKPIQVDAPEELKQELGASPVEQNPVTQQTEAEWDTVETSATETHTSTVTMAPPTKASHAMTSTAAHASGAKPAEATAEAHAIYVLPDPPRVPTGGPDEKFFAYLPHSGFHNQRIELANAMTLAWYFERTLLVPPVWIGWPHTTLPRQQLQRVWNNQMVLHRDSFTMHEPEHAAPVEDLEDADRLEPRQKSTTKGKGSSSTKAAPKKAPAKVLTEEECKSYAKECRKTYQDTFVAWSWLTDIELANKRVPLVDRFNMSEAFMYETTGATPETTYILEDNGKYWYQFFDEDPHDEDMIVKWDPEERKFENRASLIKLAEATKDYKLVTMGSTFGSSRLMLKKPANFRTLGHFHRSLAFRNPLLDNPSNRIRDLMGGPGRYVGVHARVGDGQFMLYAVNHMHNTFEELVFDKLKINRSYFDALRKAGDDLAASYPKPPAGRRALGEPLVERMSPWAALDHDELEERDFETPSEAEVEKRQQDDKFDVPDRAHSPLSKTLTCRRELYTDPELFALNSPLYIATDSAHPLQDPALAIFFANFPCAFVLSDFDRPSDVNSGPPVTSLRTMESATNVNDGVRLGRLLLPFMEAAVAAKAGAVSGTNGSTFSAFAAGPLHRAYQEDQHTSSKNHAHDDD